MGQAAKEAVMQRKICLYSSKMVRVFPCRTTDLPSPRGEMQAEKRHPLGKEDGAWSRPLPSASPELWKADSMPAKRRLHIPPRLLSHTSIRWTETRVVLMAFPNGVIGNEGWKGPRVHVVQPKSKSPCPTQSRTIPT